MLLASAECSRQSAAQTTSKPSSLRRDKGVGCYLPLSSVLDSWPLNPSLQGLGENQEVRCSQPSTERSRPLCSLAFKVHEFRVLRSRSRAPRTCRKDARKNVRPPAGHAPRIWVGPSITHRSRYLASLRGSPQPTTKRLRRPKRTTVNLVRWIYRYAANYRF